MERPEGRMGSSAGERKGPGGGLRLLLSNLREAPRDLWDSVVRHGAPNSPRARSQTVFSNLFLHIHPVRVHRWSLRKTFTLGLGVATTSLFVILVVTGIMLMVYYKPSVADAYNSIKDIHYVVAGGRLLRNAHRWAGHLMVLTVFLHMARVFLTCSYRKPRVFNWLVGVLLLVLTLALSFTGYCLPWDQLAYWATVIGSNIAGSPKELTDALHITGSFNPGGAVRQILLGSRELGGDTLIRLYWFHCILLPLLAVLFIAVHFWRIRKDGGLSRPEEIRPEELEGTPADDLADASFTDTEKTYTLMCLVPGESRAGRQAPEQTVMSVPHLFRAEMAVFMLTLAVVLFFGVFFNAPLKDAANPAIPENPAKAPWYFLGLQELVSYSALAGGLIVPTMAILALASIPFLGKGGGVAGRWPRGRSLRWVGVSCAFSFLFVVALLAVVVEVGWLRKWFPDINQLWIILFNPGTVLVAVFLLYSLAVVKFTGSPRLGAIAVFCCILVAFAVLTYFGTFHRGTNWEFFLQPLGWIGR